MNSKAIVVCGAGMTHSLGGLEKLRQRLPLQPGAAADVDNLADIARLLPGVSLRRVPRLARMALLAALRAQEEAGGPQPETGLVLGVPHGSVQMNMDFMDSILDHGPKLSSPTAFSCSVSNMCSGMLSLLLGLRAPCLTVSQFELSFAAALTAAITLLRGGRARRMLVCTVDELDARFSACCPELQHPELPRTEGAVCLCLEADVPGDAGVPGKIPLEVGWGEQDWGQELLLSGAAQGQGVRHRALYGHTPLAQALDCLLALDDIAGGAAAGRTCLCADQAHGRYAGIHLGVFFKNHEQKQTIAAG